LASRYLQQLCKHFAHKVAVSYTPEYGQADMPTGPCTMHATDGVLHITCQSDSAEGLEKMQQVIDTHLQKFAWREGLDVVWQQQPQADTADT
jgi:hypothetical protein